MKFKSGDKVQLINEAVEATISKVHSDAEVSVVDENGFEYRLNVSEIVPLMDDSDVNVKESEQETEYSGATNKKNLLKYFSSNHSCFLCIVPDEFENLLHSGYSFMLVNSTHETVLYSLVFPESGSGFSTYGILEPQNETSIVISNFIRQKSNRVIIRFIIHSAEYKTGQCECTFTPEDFLSEKLFLSPALFQNHVLAFDICAKDEMEIPEGEIKKLVDYFSPEKIIPRKESAAPKRRNEETVLLTNEKTVDLHIEELTDDYSGMTNSEMLNLQLSHFKKELDSAMLNHYFRIIFIHGKGNGVLKKCIRKELDSMNLKYHDADTAKFGYGATEVFF